MKTYYIELNVVPSENNEQYELVGGTLACCWILSLDPKSAYHKSRFYVEKDDWEIKSVELIPLETSRDNFINRDIGLEQYDKAQINGIAIVYTGWSRDGKTQKGPIELKSTYNFDLSQYIKGLKNNKRRGRCLHYDAGVRCNEIINAHSIQNKGLLSIIARDGLVYGLAYDIGNIIKNKGNLSYKIVGINRISTFLGFCKKHDNEIFNPIDNFSLLPNDQQVFLYGYRSLCM